MPVRHHGGADPDRRTQLAILVCSVAVWRLLEERGIRCSVAAGHSLGEYSALVATGYLSFADALTVVNDAVGRCRRVGKTWRHDGGGSGDWMATLSTRSALRVGDVWPANYNSPGQIVISGGDEAVRKAGELAVERGAKRAIPLAVGGAFHTPFMAGAAESLSQALAVTNHRAEELSSPRPKYGYPEAEELAQVLANSSCPRFGSHRVLRP